MACDPNTLLAEANCIMYCIPPGDRKAVIVSLLCQIMQGGGVVDTNHILTNTGDFLTTNAGENIDWD